MIDILCKVKKIFYNNFNLIKFDDFINEYLYVFMIIIIMIINII